MGGADAGMSEYPSRSIAGRSERTAGLLSLHLGAHKTASTHLQQSLRQVREELGQGGLCYAGPKTLRAMTLAEALERGGASRPARECRQAMSELAANHAQLLLSEENILGGTRRYNMIAENGVLYPHAGRRVRQVIQMAGRGNATLFLSLRDPAAYNQSAFALQVSLGNEIELDPWLHGRDPTRVRWSGLVKRLAAIDSVDRIVIWRYEDYRELRPRVLELMLGEELAALIPELPPSNVSLTQAGYDWFRKRAMADSEEDLRVLVRRAQRRFSRDAGHAPLQLFDDEVRARSALMYAREVSLVRATEKVQFLDP